MATQSHFASGLIMGLLACCYPLNPASGQEDAESKTKLIPKATTTSERKGNAKNAPWIYVFRGGGYKIRVPGKYQKLSSDANKPVDGAYTPELLDLKPDPKRPSLASFFAWKRETGGSQSASPSFLVYVVSQPCDFSASTLESHRTKLLRFLKGRRPRTTSMRADPATLSGREGLRIDTTFSAVDGTHRRTTLLVSGNDRSYEITFRYPGTMSRQVEKDIEFVRGSFLLDGDSPPETLEAYKSRPPVDTAEPAPDRRRARKVPAEVPSGWRRVAVWTIGSFFVGVLLYYVLAWISKTFLNRQRAQKS